MPIDQAQRGADSSDSGTILPGHAWMVGVVVNPDGALIAPPAAAGPDAELAAPEPEWARGDEPACTCPGFCALDHEAGER